MRKKVLLILIALLTISLDQFSKIHVEKTLLTYHNQNNLKEYRGQQITVIPNFFSISYVRNQGAAWGIGANMDDAYRDTFFFGMTFLSMLFLIGWFYFTKPEEDLVRLCLTMVLAGAVGNVIDRIRLKYVIDFLDFSFAGTHFPAFNVADSSITTGVTIMVIFFFYDTRSSKIDTPKPSLK